MTRTQYRQLRKEHPELRFPTIDDLDSKFRSMAARSLPATLIRNRSEYLLSKDAGPDIWSFKARWRAPFIVKIRDMKPWFDPRILKA